MKSDIRWLMVLWIPGLIQGCHEASVDAKPDDGGTVVTRECNEAENMCLSDTEVLHCVGDVRKREYCNSGELCFDGRCGKVVCEPGKILSCLDNGKYHGCNSKGTGEGDFDCPTGQTCVDGQCQNRLCMPDSGKCKNDEVILMCNEAGTAYTVEKRYQDTSPKTICDNDQCVPICEKTVKEASYIGCEYWAVDLDNAIDAGVYDAQGQPFAVVLSNTHGEWTANVKIYERVKNQTKEIYSFEIPPNGLRTAYLPSAACYAGGGSCDKAYSVISTNITESAFYIKSDLPITAAQFNPLENVDVFSNDASLLFPTTALGQRYIVMGREQHYDIFPAFVTIVAVEPGQTEVSFTASCKILEGKDKKGNIIYSMKKNDTQIFYLSQYDVLNLETAGYGEDPTGSIVSANKKVAVFAGNKATSIPETDPVTCCADHIEHQQYPVGAWGKTYNAVKLKPRGEERDVWRILSRSDNTRVRTTPNVFGSRDEVTLNYGEWIDITTEKSFTIEATNPVLVGQFMVGAHDPLDPETMATGFRTGGEKIGDPAYLIGVPTEQYRKSYKFLTPGKYKYDYITVVAPKSASVSLDGKPIEAKEFFDFGSGDFHAAYVLVADGPHDLEATEPVGLFSYGYDSYVSYAYPAGLDLKDLFE